MWIQSDNSCSLATILLRLSISQYNSLCVITVRWYSSVPETVHQCGGERCSALSQTFHEDTWAGWVSCPTDAASYHWASHTHQVSKPNCRIPLWSPPTLPNILLSHAVVVMVFVCIRILWGSFKLSYKAWTVWTKWSCLSPTPLLSTRWLIVVHYETGLSKVVASIYLAMFHTNVNFDTLRWFWPCLSAPASCRASTCWILWKRTKSPKSWKPASRLGSAGPSLKSTRSLPASMTYRRWETTSTGMLKWQMVKRFRIRWVF